MGRRLSMVATLVGSVSVTDADSSMLPLGDWASAGRNRRYRKPMSVSNQA